jgi:hypothetical protein
LGSDSRAQTKKTHHIFAAVHKATGQIYTDQTGRFLTPSLQTHQVGTTFSVSDNPEASPPPARNKKRKATGTAQQPNRNLKSNLKRPPPSNLKPPPAILKPPESNLKPPESNLKPPPSMELDPDWDPAEEQGATELELDPDWDPADRKLIDLQKKGDCENRKDEVSVLPLLHVSPARHGGAVEVDLQSGRLYLGQASQESYHSGYADVPSLLSRLSRYQSNLQRY